MPSTAGPRLPVSIDVRFDEALEFMRLLWTVDHGLQKHSKRMLATIGVTAPQRHVIRIVGRIKGISAGQLANMLDTHPSTLTGVLRRLERSGSLRREDDPRDGRRTLLYLTRKGRAVERTASGTVEAAIRRTLRRLSPADIGHASRTLKLLAVELGARSAGAA